ncbi:hypothetical protein clem_02825 [Legionella clemsonensis]|uniref:Uncharacterized protein n=1 Tax=Legionella clemsonensis TaxID=1867846 RepID=A0A222NZX6_9GAMM|nr:hypothetical protein clem_02825 [Legionella clemsonensis]
MHLQSEENTGCRNRGTIEKAFQAGANLKKILFT